MMGMILVDNMGPVE